MAASKEGIALLAIGVVVSLLSLVWLGVRLWRRWRGHAYAPCPTHDPEHAIDNPDGRRTTLPTPEPSGYGTFKTQDIDRAVDPLSHDVKISTATTPPLHSSYDRGDKIVNRDGYPDRDV